MQSSALYIYRASAGAGKTHTLVLEYLKRALEHPDRFSQILAITFTNRATQEMKERILEYLYALAQGIGGPVACALLQEKGGDMAMLQSRAQAVLSAILHQYTRFSVSTIDSFFQKVVRGFAHELELPGNFQIEIDQAHVLAQIIHALLASAKQDPDLQRWLMAFSEDKLLRGKSWRVKYELSVLGQAIFEESFRTHEDQLIKSLRDPAMLPSFLAKLDQHIQQFEQQLRTIGQRVASTITQAGLVVDDFLYGATGVVGYLLGLATKSAWTPSKRALHALVHEQAWYSPTSPKKASILQVVRTVLKPSLQEVVQFYHTHHRTYYTALEMRHLLYAFGTVTRLLEKLNTYRSTHNVMLVSDAALLLRKIIASHEAPFVYEKIGAFYRHYLIDEFQDMSRFQWANVKPLVENSLTEGYTSLVVGDVKQSIYRWRGGDWRLLLYQLSQEIAPTTPTTLAENWRSKQHIIDFNNVFFARAANVLTQHLMAELDLLQDAVLQENLKQQIQELRTVYKDAAQQIPTQRIAADKGYVQVSFLKDTTDNAVKLKWREEVKMRLPLLLETLQRDGFALQDIALLVRSNIEGREIFRTLLAYQQSPQAKAGYRYDVVSRESLYLSHSPWVNLLMNALRCLVDATDTLAQATLSHLYQVHVQQVPATTSNACFQGTSGVVVLPEAFVAQRLYLQQLPLYELVATLIEILGLRKVGNMAFLQAFQDVVLAFVTKEAPDIAQFLVWWEEQGTQHTLPHTAVQDAMTLMTMHQAKGLQFKVVIVPFCAWSLDHNVQHPPLLWCRTDDTPFGDIPIWPVRYSSRLKHTFYARAYYEERMQVYLDHLNLLYVAFTRPQDRLYVFAQYPPKSALKTISDVAFQTFVTTQTEAADEKQASQGFSWDPTLGVFTMG